MMRMMSAHTASSEPQVGERLAVMLVTHGVEVMHDLALLCVQLFDAQHDGIEGNAH